MGRRVWVPVVTGPLAPYAAGFSSWLASGAYSCSAAADRLYQFGQLSRWLAREGALSSCWVMRVAGAALGRDGVVVALWSGGCGGQSGDLVPGGESGGHLVSVLGRGESVTAGPEVG